jgi:hypothetical protein
VYSGMISLTFRINVGAGIAQSLSRRALGLTQSPNQWDPGTLSLGVKWPEREDGHSPLTSAELKKM